MSVGDFKLRRAYGYLISLNKLTWYLYISLIIFEVSIAKKFERTRSWIRLPTGVSDLHGSMPS
jgi:hypothetical protein